MSQRHHALILPLIIASAGLFAPTVLAPSPLRAQEAQATESAMPPQPAGDFTLPLWPGMPPLQTDTLQAEVHNRTDKLRISNVQVPRVEVFLPDPDKATGMAVVIFPGGGYSVLAYETGGSAFGEWLSGEGIAAIVVTYRLPLSTSLTDAKEAPLMDAQRAVRLTRHHAAAWGVDPGKVGVMGFSAGGHVASSVSTLYGHAIDRPMDAIDGLSARPDFSILVYPVITFRDPFVHKGSRRNLIGESLPSDQIERFSNESNVTGDTPPTFLIHSQDDRSVPVENSLLYYQALREHKVPSAMHLYPDGGHGFGMGDGRGSVEGWTRVLHDWLIDWNAGVWADIKL